MDCTPRLLRSIHHYEVTLGHVCEEHLPPPVVGQRERSHPPGVDNICHRVPAPVDVMAVVTVAHRPRRRKPGSLLGREVFAEVVAPFFVVHELDPPFGGSG